ncbi:Detected protein of confused Function [Hibiscus syriacus]|uniref:Detected protein of confused Function n=1 Tax=Hibiscus syriacus TaxID=106335 RepID=A0A6A2X1Q7_HIBSY|nr:Detected protein of confused Function [Hibiscus syriacus]
MRGESEEERRNAELWFETALSYSPTQSRLLVDPFTWRVCIFSEEDRMQKASESSDATTSISNSEDKPQAMLVPDKVKEEVKLSEAKVEINQIFSCILMQIANDDKNKENIGTVCSQENGSSITEKSHLNVPCDEEKSKYTVQVQTEACTPKPLMDSPKKLSCDKKHQTAKKIASDIRNLSVLKPKTGSAGTSKLGLENQAVKRQKLDGGRSRQFCNFVFSLSESRILNVKPHILPHKSKLGLTGGSSNLNSEAKTFSKSERKVYVREQAAPFISMAEMMNKFQSCTRDLSLPHSSLSNINKQNHIILAPTSPCFLFSFTKFLPTNRDNATTVQLPTLKLTRPTAPEFETAQRVCPVTVKSTAELEEEMMAKIPKFKARPLNKKYQNKIIVLFQEFHLETMARASKNVEMSLVASTEVSRQSKGELGSYGNAKKQLTIPEEFHFATHERIPPPVAVFDLFDKERGSRKEQKFMMEIIEKQLDEERARVPKANPYPYTTDYPVIPPKPEPKQCTKPEPFQSESLVRQYIRLSVRCNRTFLICRDPILVPEKVRKPLIQVQEFDLQVNHRAVDRAEFDQKLNFSFSLVEDFHSISTPIMNLFLQINEKEMIYKRYKEDVKAARMIEAEKELKQLRRTTVPHARPVPKFDHPFCPQK